MSDDGLTAGIIGLSWIGADPPGDASDPVLGTATPYSHASAYAAHPRIRRLVGCDTSAEARDAFERTWAPRFPDVRTYADADELLRDAAPDVVSVVTPDHLHARFAIAAMDAGVPMVFCEKPLAVSLADADAIIDAAERTGATVSVNYTRRWDPETVEARALIAAGAIGTVSQVILQLGGPRAMLFRNGTHLIDAMSHFADAEPSWVFAALEAGFEDYGTEYRGNGRDAELEPGANILVEYANGVRGYIAAQKSMPRPDVTQIIGSAGRIILDASGARLEVPAEAAEATSRRLVPRHTRAGMAAAVADLIDSHERGVPTSSTPQHARRAVAITAAALESQARGNARVDLVPPPSGRKPQKPPKTPSKKKEH